MRALAVFLLIVAPAAADEVLLKEARAWRGTIEVRSVARDPTGEGAAEEQSERVDVLLVTEPVREGEEPRLPLRPRTVEGRYELRIDHRDDGVLTRGGDAGDLRARLRGWIDPVAGRYRLELEAAPARIVAKTTLSGIEDNRFQTFRTVATRPLLLASFEAESELAADRRSLEGSRAWTDRKLEYPREVTVSWRLERIDPVVRGRVVDHRGRPLEGLTVVASMTNAGRRGQGLPPLRREGATDAEGRFSIDVFHGHWGVAVEGVAEGARVVAGAVHPDGVRVSFEEAPALEIEVPVYDLRALPDARLLHRYFEGDVERYLAYVRERVPEARLRRARID